MGELSTVCSQIVLKCLYLARIGRPDTSWCVNKLARAVTKWTKACDKTLGAFDFLHSSHMWIQVTLLWENTAQQCRLGLFQDSDFARNFEDSKSTSGGLLCIFGSHTFVSISWMWKKQTPVSHSSTEAEIIFLDARTEFPRLIFFWSVIEVFLSPKQINKSKSQESQRNLSWKHHTPYEKPKFNQARRSWSE